MRRTMSFFLALLLLVLSAVSLLASEVDPRLQSILDFIATTAGGEILVANFERRPEPACSLATCRSQRITTPTATQLSSTKA